MLDPTGVMCRVFLFSPAGGARDIFVFFPPAGSAERRPTHIDTQRYKPPTCHQSLWGGTPVGCCAQGEDHAAPATDWKHELRPFRICQGGQALPTQTCSKIETCWPNSEKTWSCQLATIKRQEIHIPMAFLDHHLHDALSSWMNLLKQGRGQGFWTIWTNRSPARRP